MVFTPYTHIVHVNTRNTQMAVAMYWRTCDTCITTPTRRDVNETWGPNHNRTLAAMIGSENGL